MRARVAEWVRTRRRRVAAGAVAVVLASTGLGYVGWRHFHHPDVNWEWQLAGVDGDRLSIQFRHGACDIFHGIRVREDQQQVVVALRVRPWRSGFCIAPLLLTCEHIQLRQPLGDRALLNAVVDPPVVVTSRRAPTAEAQGPCGEDRLMPPKTG